MTRKHPNEFMRTNLNSERIAGTGITEDDYGEDSFPDFDPHARRTEPGRMSSRFMLKSPDTYSKEAVSDKNGDVRIIRPAIDIVRKEFNEID